MQAEEKPWIGWFNERDQQKLRASLIDVLATKKFDFILHPLGFYCAILDTEGPSKLRLHYWRQQEREVFTAITPFHDHVWRLKSLILVGKIENVTFDLEPHPEGNYQLAQIKQYDGVDEVVPTGGRINLISTNRQTYNVGDFYEIEPGVFHCSNVPADLVTITLVHSEIVFEGGPRTLVPIGFRGQDPYRELLPKSHEIQKEVLELINSSNS